MPPVDALLVFTFGGPEGPDDVMPFLRNVTAGRNVPDERLAVVAEQYERFGGRSPINDQSRALIAALEQHFATTGVELPIYWGNRNWQPYLTDTVTHMAADGVQNALVFVTSAFGSYSGCRQYRENLIAAGDATDGAPRLQKLRLFYNHPGFIEPAAERVADALAAGGSGPRRLLFTAHSIPKAMADACDYEAQLREAADLVAERLPAGSFDEWELVFQSRSGPPQVPWLEPDVGDRLGTLADEGVTSVTLCPLGFVSDHMEVLYDLDTLALDIAGEVGIDLNRAATVGTDPRFVAMIADLVAEQMSDAPRLFLGSSGPWPDECPDQHCQYNPGRPAAARA